VDAQIEGSGHLFTLIQMTCSEEFVMTLLCIHLSGKTTRKDFWALPIPLAKFRCSFFLSSIIYFRNITAF